VQAFAADLARHVELEDKILFHERWPWKKRRRSRMKAASHHPAHNRTEKEDDDMTEPAPTGQGGLRHDVEATEVSAFLLTLGWKGR
jgi:hypothetical protein